MPIPAYRNIIGILCQDWRQMLIVLALFFADSIFAKLCQTLFQVPPEITLSTGIAAGAIAYCGIHAIPVVLLGAIGSHFILNNAYEPIDSLFELSNVLLISIGAATSLRMGILKQAGTGKLKKTRFAKALLILLTTVIISTLFTSGLRDLTQNQATDPFQLGDTIIRLYFGLLLITPLTLFLLNRITNRLQLEDLDTNHTILPLAFLVISIVSINLFTQYIYHEEKKNNLTKVELNFINLLKNHFSLLEQKVVSLKKLIENSDEVTLQEFNGFVDWAIKDEMELIGFSWNRAITESEFTGYFEELNREYPNLDITPKHIQYPSFSQHELAIIIDKIYPFKQWKNVIGLDVMTEDNRRNAILSAMKSGDLAYTSSINLQQLSGTNEVGLLVFAACCKSGATAENPERFPSGFAVGVVNFSALLKAILQEIGIDDYLIVEIDEISEHATPINYTPEKSQKTYTYVHTFDIDLKNKRWQARIYPSAAYWHTDYHYIRLVALLSLLFTIYALFSTINTSIRQQQMALKAGSNAEFINFIGQMEELVLAKLSSDEESKIIINVYSSFLEASSVAQFNTNGELLAIPKGIKTDQTSPFPISEKIVQQIKAVAANSIATDVVIEKTDDSLSNQSIVLFPWVTHDSTTLVMGFLVNTFSINEKKDKLLLLTNALSKVNEIRRSNSKSDKLIQHLRELNELLAEAEHLGQVGSFKINLERDTFYFSKQALLDIGTDCHGRDAARYVFQRLSFAERKRLIESLRSPEGEATFTLIRTNNEVRKLRIKWNSTFDKRAKRVNIFGVVADITEHLLAEKRRLDNLAREELVKEALHELTFDIAGSSASLQQKMVAIASKARELLKVSRASIWFLENDNQQLTCKALATTTDCLVTGMQEMVLQSHEFPHYFSEITKNSALIINKDIGQHPCTAGMYASYLQPLDIQALADFPIIEDNRVVGVICFEQQGGEWAPSQEDILLGNTISALMAKVIEADAKAEILKQLITQQQEREQILSSMVDAVITINERGIIQTVNQATLDTFEYSADELVGSNVSILMNTRDRDHHDGYLSQYVAHGKANIIGIGREVEGRTRTGRAVPLRLSVTEIEHHHTKERIFVGVLHDLTVEAEQRKRIIHSEKMDALGLMTGGIAHDFNNILGIILGYTEMIIDTEDELDSEIRQYATQIEIAGARAKDLIAKIRTVSKTETLEQLTLNPWAVLQGCWPMLEKAVAASNVRLAKGHYSKDFLVRMNQGDFENALLNLCINAMHASKPGQEIVISLTGYTLSNQDKVESDINYDEMLCVSVSDSGTGMSKETQERLFEPFYSTKGEQGTGLGLAQVYGFVQRTGGFARVNSAIGKGSTVSMYLPLSTEKQQSPAPEPTISTHIDGSKSLLIAEDEANLRNILAVKFRALGYTVYEAVDGAAAMTVLDNYPVDLVLTDVIMPNIDGIQLANYAKTHYPHAKLQLMSGFSDMRQVDLIDERIYHSRLIKPFKIRDAVERVQQLLSE